MPVEIQVPRTRLTEMVLKICKYFANRMYTQIIISFLVKFKTNGWFTSVLDITV